MPYLTKLRDDGGDTHLVLLQREIEPGTLIDTDGLTSNYVVIETTRYLDTRGKDFSLTVE